VLPGMGTSDATSTRRDQCFKCDEEISVEAERCPECGYEPGGTLSTLLAVLIGLPMTLFGGVLLIGVPWVVVTEDVPIVSAIMGLLVAVALAGTGGALLYMIKVAGSQKPVDDPPWNPS